MGVLLVKRLALCPDLLNVDYSPVCLGPLAVRALPSSVVRYIIGDDRRSLLRMHKTDVRPILSRFIERFRRTRGSRSTEINTEFCSAAARDFSRVHSDVQSRISGLISIADFGGIYQLYLARRCIRSGPDRTGRYARFPRTVNKRDCKQYSAFPSFLGFHLILCLSEHCISSRDFSLNFV